MDPEQQAQLAAQNLAEQQAQLAAQNRADSTNIGGIGEQGDIEGQVSQHDGQGANVGSNLPQTGGQFRSTAPGLILPGMGSNKTANVETNQGNQSIEVFSEYQQSVSHGTQKRSSSAHMSTLDRIKRIGAKRIKNEEGLDNFNVNINPTYVPQIQAPNPQQPSNVQGTSSEVSLPSSIDFVNKFRNFDNQQKQEYTQLVLDQKDANLDELLLKLQETQQQEQNFRQQSFQKRQEDFMSDATTHIQFVENKLLELYNSTSSTNKEMFKNIQANKQSTSRLFEWHYMQTSKSAKEQSDYSQSLAKRTIAIERMYKEIDEYIGLLITQTELMATIESVTNLENKTVNVCNNIMQSVNGKLKEIVASLNTLQLRFHEMYDEMSTNFHIIEQYTNHQEVKITDLESQIQQMSTRMQRIETMSTVAYFTSNVLCDQDRIIKDGLQESSSKQANMLDLVTRTNNLLQQVLPDERHKQMVEKEFKDSVRSLNLDQKTQLNLPQCDKIPEFLQVNTSNIPNEREQMHARAQQDQTRKNYEHNVEQFFQQYPKQYLHFMQTTIKEDDEVVQDDIEHPEYVEDKFATIGKNLEKLNDLTLNPSLNVKPKPGVYKLSSPKIKKESPKLTPKRPITFAPSEPQMDYNKYAHMEVPPRGTMFTTIPSHKSYYHKFNFRQKYQRNIHPKMFLLQFDTMANQYDLSDSHKVQQFMFCMEGEYLDWYKERCLSGRPITWDELKFDFIKTYTASNDDAKDELIKQYQRANESADQYLQRLRKIIETSDLTDAHVKTQFASGLSSNGAKQYLTNMKQFNRPMYSQHTSTTLLHDLVKNSHIFNFTLNPIRPNITNPTTKTTTTRFYRSPNRSSSYKPNNYKPYNSLNANKNANSNFKKAIPSSIKKTANVAHVDDAKPISDDQKSQQLSNDLQQDQSQNQQDQSEQNSQPSYQYDPTSDFKDNTLQEMTIEVSKNYDDQDPMHVSGVMFIGDLIENFPNQNQPNASIQPGETHQLHNVFRKGQKQQNTFSEKLTELAKQGKKLPQTDYQTIRSLQYISLPEQQLLAQSPQQFISACEYLQKCYENDQNVLQEPRTQQVFNSFMNMLYAKMSEILPLSIDNIRYGKPRQPFTIQEPNKPIENTQNDQPIITNLTTSNAIITIQPVDYLYYVNLQFEGKPIFALIDTGSSAIVISEQFCNKNAIKIPHCKYSREVFVADGSSTIMPEWQDARIRLDDYMSIQTNILISKGNTFDMLLGLNACVSIGATIQHDFLRYCVNINDKERFGKLPISKIPHKPLIK